MNIHTHEIASVLPLIAETIAGPRLLAGFTDVLDGTIARKYGTTSELGAKLDSVADLLFYLVMLVKIFPVMWATLPKKIWIAVGAVLVVRGCAYLIAAAKYHRFAAQHTYMNKVSGLMVFGVPYAIILPIAVPYCWSVCAVTMLASAEELLIHLSSKEYDSTRRALLRKAVN